MTIREDWGGIYPALPAPYGKDGHVNKEALRAVMDQCLAAGVRGFYAGGSTGEAFILPVAMRKELLAAIAEVNAGRGKLIAQIGSIVVEDAVELARYAETLGYDAISSVTPFYFKFSFSEIRTYYMTLVDAVKLPLFLYNIPALSGVSLTMDNFRSLLSDPRIIGVKFTSGDMYLMEQMRAAFPEKVIFNGYDEMLTAGLVSGADGGIGSTYNVMPEKFVAIRNAVLKNDISTAQKIQHEANAIITAFIEIGVIPGVKSALSQQFGIDFGDCKPPFAPLSAEAHRRVKTEILEKL